MQSVSGLFVTTQALSPAINIRFGARLAGRCTTQAAVILFGFCSGLDEHR